MKPTATFWFSVALASSVVAGGVSNFVWYQKHKRATEAVAMLYENWQEALREFAVLQRDILVKQVQKDIMGAENKIKPVKD